MSRIAFGKVSFNGGELSRRLRARRDQSIYAIGLKEMTGYAPLMEGPAEAMPGTLRVAAAPGPCRLMRFEYNKTQGHVIEASAGLMRVYTNDELLTVDGVPVSVVTPWTWAETQELKVWQSYDVLYCFHETWRPRQFVRNAATAFDLETLTFENGPFEDRNKDKDLLVKASALTGDVTLQASSDIFVATDVGGLFMLEVEDFGDTPAWEPGITVSAGALRVSLEKVYRAATGGKTGSVQPSHTTGLAYDGMASGQDINEKPAGGVQWEFLHDKYGILTITGFTDGSHVSATVLRHLPFSAVNFNYAYGGGYYTGLPWIPPDGSVPYSYGTWRWRFGAYSDTRGYPSGGCIWNERLCLSRGNRVDCSVVGDLNNFAIWNENGDMSEDMAVTGSIDDPNAITALVPGDRLLIYNAAGVFTLGAQNAAKGFGPENYRFRRENSAGAGQAAPIRLDDRTFHIDRSGRRIYDCAFDGERGFIGGNDLTRYARHMGKPGFVELATQQEPVNMVWAVRGDGSLAAATYYDKEQVLGWSSRPLGAGIAARSITWITDPEGLFDQIWIAAEFAGSWHVLRMAPWRQDGDYDTNAVMTDLSAVFDDDPATEFVAPWLASKTVDIVADGRFYLNRTLSGGGGTVLPVAASKVAFGIRFPAAIEDLPIEGGGDNGPAQGKMARISRAWVKVEQARGILIGTPGHMHPVEREVDPEAAIEPVSDFVLVEAAGDHTREPCLRIERVAPAQSTIMAWGGTCEVKEL